MVGAGRGGGLPGRVCTNKRVVFFFRKTINKTKKKIGGGREKRGRHINIIHIGRYRKDTYMYTYLCVMNLAIFIFIFRKRLKKKKYKDKDKELR